MPQEEKKDAMHPTIAWFNDIRGNDSVLGAAKKAGIDGANLHRHIGRGKLPPNIIILLAHGYNVSAIYGLLEGQWLNEGDIEDFVSTRSLREASDLEIARELVRRLRSTGATLDMLNMPTSNS